jgi:hypothetical protein
MSIKKQVHKFCVNSSGSLNLVLPFFGVNACNLGLLGLELLGGIAPLCAALLIFVKT